MAYTFDSPQTTEQHRIWGLFLRLLESKELQAGSNHLIDKNGDVWICETWASGGIWFVKNYNEQDDSPEVFAKAKRRAALDRRTIFEKP